MSEGPAGGQDSRREQEPVQAARDSGTRGGESAGPGHDSVSPRGDAPPATPRHGASPADTYDLYRRGLDLLGRGSAAAAAQLLERAAAAEPQSRSVLEALARAQFDARRYAAAAGNFRRIVEASPSDDYAQFGLGLALARTGDPQAAAEHLALAAAMRPDLRHYTDALRGVRATLRARSAPRSENPNEPDRTSEGD
jgi:tetratricopeptide (TPR) repeat protein